MIAGEHRCCLCGRWQSQVARLVVGVQGAVCSECVQVAATALRQPPGGWPLVSTPDSSADDPATRRARLEAMMEDRLGGDGRLVDAIPEPR